MPQPPMDQEQLIQAILAALQQQQGGAEAPLPSEGPEGLPGPDNGTIPAGVSVPPEQGELDSGTPGLQGLDEGSLPPEGPDVDPNLPIEAAPEPGYLNGEEDFESAGAEDPARDEQLRAITEYLKRMGKM